MSSSTTTPTVAKDAIATSPEVDEIEAMKRRVKEMEEEANKLREMQSQLEATASEQQDDVDGRSIYVGNVDYGATPEELQTHFQACGTINRVTINCDKFSGHPKGFAYIEFAEGASVANAMVLNESLFRGRMLQVVAKRTNIPGFNKRGRGRGGFRGARGGFRGRRPFRGRGRGSFYTAPY